MPSVGVYRHLSQASDVRGTFTILALDHRDNLVADLQKHADRPVTAADVVAFKAAVLRAANAGTALLTDPDYGLPALADGLIPGRIGLLAPLEVTDYRPPPGQRQLKRIPDWTVATLKRAGLCGAKLLIYYHPDSPDAAAKTAVVDGLIEECRSADVPMYLEPIAYSLDAERGLSSDERRRVVVESARHFSRRGPAVMKLEFPLDVKEDPDPATWPAALAEVDAACQTPWALLSGGTSFDTFLGQTVAACEAGASGVIAGRAIWAEAVPLSGAERDRFVRDVARERLARLSSVCRALGRPWMAKTERLQVGPRWYA